MYNHMEINVIVDADVAGPSSADERALFFETLAAENKNIPRPIIDAFAEMFARAEADDARSVEPTIAELLLRRVITDGGQHAIPVLRTIFTRAPITGGAFPRIVKRAEQPRTGQLSSAPSLKVRFDMPIMCVWARETRSDIYIAPAGEEISVVGLMINPRYVQPLIPSDASAAKLIPTDNFSSPVGESLRSRLLTGRYKYDMISRHDALGEVDPTRSRYVSADSPEFMRTMHEQFVRLNVPPEPLSIHNAIDIGIMTRVGTTIPRAFIDMLTVRKWPAATVNPASAVTRPLAGRSAAPKSVLEVFEAVHFGRFTTVTVDSILADMMGRRFTSTYMRAMLSGKDDSRVREGLAEIKLRHEHAAIAASARAKRLDEHNTLEIYRSIIARKLGAKRLQETDDKLRARPSLRAEASSVLGLLSPADRKIVEAEYDARIKYIEEAVTNKCPHVKIYRRLRHSLENRITSKLLGELRDYFDADTTKNPHAKINCRMCKHEIICPHVLDYITLDLAGKPQTEIKAKLTKYIERAERSDVLSCKICGEILSSMEEFEVADVRSAASNMDEELRTLMWGELAGLVRHLKFDTLVDTRTLITSARETIYPYVFDLEKQILKSKTSGADEIKAKLRLYVAIYGAAYLVRIVEKSESIKFRDHKAGATGKSTAAELIKFALDLIMSTRNVIIREIPGMSLDVVKNALVGAYKTLTGSDFASAPTASYDGLLAVLLIDPTYRYYYSMDLFAQGRKPRRHNDMADSASHIMGADISKLERVSKSASGRKTLQMAEIPPDLFEHVVAPKLPPTDKFMALKKFVAAKSISDDAIRGYVSKSFEMFARKQRDRVYLEHQFIDVADKRSSVLDVKMRPIHAKLREAALEMYERESVIYAYRTHAHLQAYGPMPRRASRLWPNPTVSLSRVYDEAGLEHKWDIYVVEREGVPPARVELTARKIAAGVEAGEKFVGTVVDRKCSTCGRLRSEVSIMSEAKIRESLRSRNAKSNLFRFYDHRCPAGGLHEFGSDATLTPTCAKCGLVRGSEPDAYFIKFAAKYDEERKSDSAGPAKTLPKPPTDTSHYVDEYASWVFDFNIVLDLAKKVGVNHRLIVALGASTGAVAHADVLSGDFIPGDVDDRQSTRAAIVNSHVRTLFTEYNRLKNFASLVKPPYDLSSMVDASGYPKHKLADLANALPPIYDDYNTRYLHISRIMKPREIIEFCIQAFCQRCLRIWEGVGKDAASTERIRRDFVIYIVKKVLRGEELMTKPGHFNWSLLYGDSGKEKTFDSNTARDEIVRDDDEEDPGPMSTDAFDVEDDGADDDDSSNGVRVGEDLGMD